MAMKIEILFFLNLKKLKEFQILKVNCMDNWQIYCLPLSQ